MSIAERFMAKVSRQDDGCWLWMASVQAATGYGRFGIGGTVDYAHRAAYRLFVGEIAPGMLVCHRCDVRRCVNPDHLFVGTHAENMKDASRKGRVVLPPQNFASSEAHQVAKLTNAQVREIRRAPSARGLAKRYGVSRSAIWSARTGKTFKDVPCA